jgi:hypothetical protein
MEFKTLVEQVLEEDVVAGGSASAFGPNVSNTSTVMSGDNYAPGDARTPKSLYGGTMTRNGIRKKKSKKKK